MVQAPEPNGGRYGARVFYHADGVIQIYQTIKRGTRYVIDQDKNRFINPGSDQQLADAIRAAGRGEF